MQESDKRGQAREEAVSNAGPAADLSRDAELGFSVTRDVLSLAARMASALGISVPDDRWPTVTVGDSSPTSSYSPDDNSITIAKKDLNNGSTYAEEVTHFLKAITTPPPEVREDNLLDIDHYKVVQEICGRLGRDFAERLCAGSALAHLFVGPKEDEGAKISDLARDASEKLESSQLLLTQRARALEASAALLRSLKGEVDQILDQEWQRDTTELPKATAFLKERVLELTQSSSTPEQAAQRLEQIKEFIGQKSCLSTYEIQQVLAVLRTGANADEFHAMRLSLETELLPLTIADAEIHGAAYSAAEDILRGYPDTWPDHFKTIMHLSLAEARDPNGFLGSL